MSAKAIAWGCITLWYKCLHALEAFTAQATSMWVSSGKLMFLHTNLSPKWSLGVPAEFAFYNRRWQVRVQQMNCSKLSCLSATFSWCNLLCMRSCMTLGCACTRVLSPPCSAGIIACCKVAEDWLGVCIYRSWSLEMQPFWLLCEIYIVTLRLKSTRF